MNGTQRHRCGRQYGPLSAVAACVGRAAANGRVTSSATAKPSAAIPACVASAGPCSASRCAARVPRHRGRLALPGGGPVVLW
jgi:hypothetical protein